MIPAYQLNNLKFNYGRKTVLAIDNLQIAAGTITTLVGPNGCGKSTLLTVLAFLEEPYEGDVLFFGKPVRKRSFFKPQSIAMLPQKPYLFRGTVEDNLLMALKFNKTNKKLWKSRVDKVLNRLQIGHLCKQQARTLSGGELQKAALARAIITEPDVLLLDEPFSYLDHDSERLMERFIRDYHADKKLTVIFSTHNRLQGLALAKEVISLVEGCPVRTPLINVYSGTLEKQLFNTGHIQVYLGEERLSGGKHISIDPKDIVVSKQAVIGMQNQFFGRVTAIQEEKGGVLIKILAGETFQVLISHDKLDELDLRLGERLWLGFKPDRVVVF